jgi:hypothetical protein
MREQDETLGVSNGISTLGTTTPVPNHAEQSSEVAATIIEASENDASPPAPPTSEYVKSQATEDPSSNGDAEGSLPGKNADADAPADDDDDDINSKIQKDVDSDSDSNIELEHELDKLFLGTGRTKKDRIQSTNDTKPKLGAAKAKRQKKAEKQAALEAEGKLLPKPLKNRKPYDPKAAMQKARGETVDAGRRTQKKK